MRSSRRLLLAVTCGILTACSSSTEPGDPVVGVWSVRTWGGKTLPAITYGIQGGYNEQIVSETLTVQRDNTFHFSRTYRYMPAATTATYTGTGTWRKTTTGYSLGRGLVPASVSGSTLTVQWLGDGRTDWIYARE